MRMNARKEQARITPLTQPAFAKKERKEERKMYERVQLHFHHLGGRVREY